MGRLFYMPKNIFNNLPEALNGEVFEPLLQTPGLLLERIVSNGQVTPEGEWYDQERDEWVLLLRGCAGLRFEGEETITLTPGDYQHIPAHCRHRVEWTSEQEQTVWLALHFEGD